jgi:signal transduction histidine kinase
MRRRLAATAAAVTATVVLAFSVPLALVVRVVARDRAMHAAELESRSLAAVLAATSDPAVLGPIIGQANAGNQRPATVFLPDGTTVGDPRLAGAELARAEQGKALTAEVPGGEAVLLPVQTADGTAIVRVFVPASELTHGVYTAWLVLAGLAVAMVVAAVALADRLGRSIVRPIGALRDVALRLQRDDRRARASIDGPPEVAEVARALNGLADRIDDMLLAERETTADLSHRLRTPMTALRLDVEQLAPGLEQAQLLQELEALEASVNELIRSARAVHETSGARLVDAAEVVRARLSFWSVLARNQGRKLSIDLPDEPWFVVVSPSDLDAAVDALVGNVFSHTPDGTPFRVAVEPDPNGRSATLVVADAGGGLSDADVLARGVSSAGSTGLGLDIARRVAESGGGTLRTGTNDDGRGTRVELTLQLSEHGSDREAEMRRSAHVPETGGQVRQSSSEPASVQP